MTTMHIFFYLRFHPNIGKNINKLLEALEKYSVYLHRILEDPPSLFHTYLHFPRRNVQLRIENCAFPENQIRRKNIQ